MRSPLNSLMPAYHLHPVALLFVCRSMQACSQGLFPWLWRARFCGIVQLEFGIYHSRADFCTYFDAQVAPLPLKA